jgi:hypothetical protein
MQGHRVHSAATRVFRPRPADEHVAVLEQRVVVQPSRDAGRLADEGVQLGHGAGIPGDDVFALDVVLDRGHHGGRDGAQLDVERCQLRLQQPAQRCHRGARPVQLRFEPLQVVGNEGGARAGVWGAQNALDVR